jgi:O-Antigen ligase
MTAFPVVGVRTRATRVSRRLSAEEVRERRLKRQVGTIWGLLVLNVLSFAPGVSIIPISSTLGKGLTQGALSLAVLLALMLNPRAKFRPNVFLLLVTLLALEAVVTEFTAQYLVGTGYRTFRYIEFVAVLWLLSPYWARPDMLIVRCHLKSMLWVLGSVALGYLISPGKAMSGGRLNGDIWPIDATQVAHYAAVTIGMVVIYWFCGQLKGRTTAAIVVLSTAILLLTHTRTALVGLAVGLVVGGLSLIAVTPRVRRLFGAIAAIAVIAFATASSAITSWMARGEGSTELTNLSGRTNFWGPLLAYPRTTFQEIFGFGLSNGSFNGLPVDSNWMISYQDQGFFGVVGCAIILVYLLIAACFQSRGVRRALALFFVVYCLAASFTEDGITNPSTYLLDVTVAASLLLPTFRNRRTA